MARPRGKKGCSRKKGRRRIQKGRSGIRIEKATCQRYVR